MFNSDAERYAGTLVTVYMSETYAYGAETALIMIFTAGCSAKNIQG
jgi:hypothetical protein